MRMQIPLLSKSESCQKTIVRGGLKIFEKGERFIIEMQNNQSNQNKNHNNNHLANSSHQKLMNLNPVFHMILNMKPQSHIKFTSPS